MLKRAYGYAYPWDYADDPDAAPRAAALGVDTVAVAGCYHVTRASTPLHPLHRIFEASSAACYVPVREEAWRGQRLVPVNADWDAHGESFGHAQRQLAAQGLKVASWIVLTHNSTLGTAHPELVVRNAFGDLYPYALCPAQEDVRAYSTTLAAEVVASAPLDGVVLEASGPMGLHHSGHHEKTEFAGWNSMQKLLLSLCFCQACTDRYAAAGLDGESVARLVRAGVNAGTAESVQDVLGEDKTAAVRTVREDVADELRKAVVGSCRSVSPSSRITVHGSIDPWATGSFSTLQPAVGDGIDAVVANCWDASTGAARIAELRSLAPPDVDVGAYLRLDRGWIAGESTDHSLRDYGAAGASELHLYHLGLLGESGLARLANVVRIARGTPAL